MKKKVKVVLIFLLLVLLVFVVVYQTRVQKTPISINSNQKANHLQGEESPYLKQHIYNPVDWYPWGDEALELAKDSDKLIFLSIGYSTCHWCHVMAEESFENQAIAKLLNKDYVSIKIDREELTHIDKKYQAIYKSIYAKNGGWPLNVIMTPDLKVVHIATYIPLERGYGSEGMVDLLPSIAYKYHYNKPQIDAMIAKNIKISNQKEFDNNQKLLKFIAETMQNLTAQYDDQNGGFGERPKFPEASKIELLTNIYQITKDEKALEMAKNTLKLMSKSGLYDIVEGGFFRYCEDAKWRTPHYEKMLYTNAQLIPEYIKMYEITKDKEFLSIAYETIENFNRYFFAQNLYFAASDAQDIKGEEGGYYIFRYDDIYKQLISSNLTPKETTDILDYLHIYRDGNVDGEWSHIYTSTTPKPPKYEVAMQVLKQMRHSRKFPFVDKKIIVSWNSMMIKALFLAGKYNQKYKTMAIQSLDKLLYEFYIDDELYHQKLITADEPTQIGLLEDYAFLIDGLLVAYETTYNDRYLDVSKKLTASAIEKFYKDNRWYLSQDDTKVQGDINDRYYTSTISVMIDNLLRVSLYQGDRELYDLAVLSIKSNQNTISLAENNSKFISVYIREKIGDFLIKSDKANLLKLNSNFNYPFVLHKVDRGVDYQICQMNRCFENANNPNELKETIGSVSKSNLAH